MLCILHSVQMPKKPIPTENGQIRKASSVRGKHACSTCDKTYDHKASLTRHMQVHTGRYNFYCEQCKLGISDRRDYKLHMDKHAGVQYKCEVCSKSFALIRSRDNHMSVHTGVYRFMCIVCTKGYNSKTEYEKHLKIHS